MSVFIIALGLLILSSCVLDKQSDDVSDTDLVGTENAQYNKKEQVIMQNEAKNSSVNGLLNDFSYLFTNIQNDVKAVRKQSYNDVVTILISEYDNDMRCFWLYDSKRNMIFQDINPYTAYMLCDYKKAYNISDSEKNDLITLLKKSDVHNWDEQYVGEVLGTGFYSWSIAIEYKNGILEKHSGRGQNPNKPIAFRNIINYFSSIKYVDNPLYEE